MALAPVRIFRNRIFGLFARGPFRVSAEEGTDRGSGRGFLKGMVPGAALLAAAFFSLSGSGLAAGYGDRIVNSARFVSAQHGAIDASVSVRIVFPTPSHLDVLAYAPGKPGAQEVTVAATGHATGPDPSFPFSPLSEPTVNGSGLNLGQPLPLQATSAVPRGHPLFIRVVDPDRNGNPEVAETILVSVSSSLTGDRETLRLTETGPDTGTFVGYINTGEGNPVPFDGILSAAPGDHVEVRYIDPLDLSDISARTILVDPYGVIFDSRTGAPVDGAVVALVDAFTGAPAPVFSDDGITPYPATVVSGESAIDGAGATHVFPPGGYRFPLMPPGIYRLLVTPPAGYAAPSVVPASELQSFSFLLREPGSYGGNFEVVDGPPIRIDIPVDPPSGALWVRKSAGKSRVAPGDFILYTLTLENTDQTVEAAGLTLSDRLPLGFSFRKGSARLNGAPLPDPVTAADGRTLTFPLADLPPGGSLEIRYVAEVGAGARAGTAVNEAWAAAAGGLGSNRAKAAVQVGEDLLRSRAILMGRVTAGGCTDDGGKGVPGVRIVMEDGAFVLTDQEGRYHFEGIRPGSHVLQMDLESLPPGYEPVACTPNTRFAGRSFSQFVDVQGGTLWRADFHIAPKEGEDAPLPEAGAQERSEKKSAAGDSPQGILSHADGALIPERIGAVRVSLDSRLEPRLSLDGKEIPAERIGMRLAEPETDRTLYSYIGVDFGPPGRRILRLEGLDPFGNARFDQSLILIRTGEIASIRLLSSEGNTADGRTPVKVRLEVRDTQGQVIRAPVSLELREGDLLPPTKAERIRTDDGSSSTTIAVDAEGYALFAPVDRSGPRRAVLAYNDVTVEVRTYVQPHLRDWILVGLAEGTAGYNIASGNMENLRASDTPEEFYQDGRLAFFAKGQIQGKWLLTMAYDSAKPSLRQEQNLFGTIDPGTYYTLYGDATRQGYEAASSEKLFLRIERDQFYALFGDFDTGLTVTELSRYSRTLTGVKTELETERVSVTAFASRTPQTFVKDEIRGDGSSGLYRLSRRNLLMNSEKIAVEVRDRFRSEIILQSRPLTRHLDYDIDYREGTLFFKEPIWSRDEGFNPIFIVVDYEVLGDLGENVNYGGRGAYRLFDRRIEVGATLVHESQGLGSGDLYGVDAAWEIVPGLALRAEGAATDSTFGGASQSGSAWLTEMVHQSERFSGRFYLRHQGLGFGLGQLRQSETGTRKFGGETAWRLSQRLSLAALAYREENLGTGAVRDLAEGQARWNSSQYSLHLGGRQVSDRRAGGGVDRSSQVIAGGAWRSTLFDRLSMRLTHDQNIGSGNSRDFPSRTLLGADYLLTKKVTAFAEQEMTWGRQENTQGTRIGMRAAPWAGGRILTSMEQQTTENTARVLANFGLKQTWQVSERLAVDGGLDRSQTIRQSDAGSTAASPNAAGDYTAVSVGTSYKLSRWMWWNRIEMRASKDQDKWGLAGGILGEPRPGLGLSAQIQFFHTESTAGTESLGGTLRFDTVWRPERGRLTLLNRLDLIVDREEGGGYRRTVRRIVENLTANVKMGDRSQISLQYGVKYVSEMIDGLNHSGVTDLYGVEARYDVTPKWDIGVRGSVLHSWNTGSVDGSFGASVGYNVMENAWISAGYNVTGFWDPDFSSAGFTAQGPYVQVRAKFDQQSVRSLLGFGESVRGPVSPVMVVAPAPAAPAQPSTPLLDAVLTTLVHEQAAQVTGSLVMPALLVNGESVRLPEIDIRMLEDLADDIVQIRGSGAAGLPLRLQADGAETASWRCRITDSRGAAVRTFSGTGAPPSTLPWDGRTEDGKGLKGGEIYHYQLEVTLRDGTFLASPRHLFGVHRISPVSLNLTGGAFALGSAELSDEARRVLKRIAELLRAYPDEKIVVEGHTDSLGNDRFNLQLSRLRSEAAAEYLVTREGLSRDRIVIRWFGQEKPIASNALEEGRELNRRVEVKGNFEEEARATIRDRYRTEAQVKIDGKAVPADALGRFSTRVPPGKKKVSVEMIDAGGRILRGDVPLPLLEIAHPEQIRIDWSRPEGPDHRILSAEPGTLSPDQPLMLYRLRGRTDPGNRVEINRLLVAVDPDGSFEVEVELYRGTNIFGLIAYTPAGGTRILNLELEMGLEGR